jgi:hypothetical protein
MSKNPHSEFLRYHGFELQGELQGDIPKTDLEMMQSDVQELKWTMQQVLQELRKLNT